MAAEQARDLITVDEARTMVMAHVPLMPAEFRKLEDAVGCVLAADAQAAADHPQFDMSAVDGYALGGPMGPWKQVDTIAAGQVMSSPLLAGECARIFTGAQVPAGCHAVVMQERCTWRDELLTVDMTVIPEGANIRRRAEAFRMDDMLLTKGARLDPASVGLLASAGLAHAMVSMVPTVSIVRTGEEFIEEGAEPAGRIHSSNDVMLIAALRDGGFANDSGPLIAGDDRLELRDALTVALDEGDVLITTGGVSVGDHDLVRPVLEGMGAAIHFHGVSQKPGKPMLFATLRGKPVFALPGNPRAVLVGWYLYVLPFLRAMEGASDPWPRSERLPIAQALRWKGGRTEFRAGFLRDGQVHLLSDEGSHMLNSMTMAEVLVELPKDLGERAPGNDILVHHLPRR
ncbi:MAG: molybdopterin molybdotransferase MoeA [Flavobacteriales bacterium]|nr:molybdopterin molybdotransferase MoeA [Flavobacteriales bacterium]